MVFLNYVLKYLLNNSCLDSPSYVLISGFISGVTRVLISGVTRVTISGGYEGINIRGINIRSYYEGVNIRG